MAKTSAVDDLRLRCKDAHDIGKQCYELDGLQNELWKIGEKAGVYTFKYRLKSSVSIEKKVLRKRLEGKKQLAVLESGSMTGTDNEFVKKNKSAKFDP